MDGTVTHAAVAEGILCRESKKQLEIHVTQDDIQARTAQFDKVPLPSGRKVKRAPAVDFQKKGVYFSIRLRPANPSTHAPRFLMLYGSMREPSFSHLLTEEAARLLRAMGGKVRIFNPSGLPLPDDAPETHAKVVELREPSQWAEGMLWCSPERHGAMTGIMKTQIGWISLSLGPCAQLKGRPWR